MPLEIPKPCHNNWDKMDPNGEGRHCNSCVKTVYDISHLAPEEIMPFLRSMPTYTCIRITDHQIAAVNRPVYRFVGKAAFFALFSMAGMAFYATAASAQVQVPVLDRRMEWESGQMKVTPVVYTAADSLHFKGTVGRLSGKLLQNAQVAVVYKNRVLVKTKTDAEGNYELSVAKGAMPDIDKIHLQFSAGGYEPKQLRNLPFADAEYKVKLRKSLYQPPVRLMGCPRF